MIPDIPFNRWSIERIKYGVKCCTARTKKYEVEGVTHIERMDLETVRNSYWRQEGANSPEEFEKVWKSIHPNRGFVGTDKVYVHWFENPYKEGKDDTNRKV